MSLPAFARLETRLAAKTANALSNIALAVGAASCKAVLDRAVEKVGEFGQFVERRDQLTFAKSALPALAPPLAPGLVVTADAAQYTTDELLALPRASWTLDALESDDGYLQVWWTR